MDKAGKCLHMKGTGNAKAQRQECQEPVGTSLGGMEVGLQGASKGMPWRLTVSCEVAGTG